MITSPVACQLKQLSEWQLRTFMVCLCERMYPNYALFCQQTNFVNPEKFKSILNLVWESLLVKKAKINFDNQLEKLAALLPESDKFDCYGVHLAIDAGEALSELVHSYLSNDMISHARRVSAISLKTVTELEQYEIDQKEIKDELKTRPNSINEIDVQREICRILASKNCMNIEIIKGLKNDLDEVKTSNIGLFLNT